MDDNINSVTNRVMGIVDIYKAEIICVVGCLIHLRFPTADHKYNCKEHLRSIVKIKKYKHPHGLNMCIEALS